MKKRSRAAQVSAFARARHAQTREVKIFDDKITQALLREEEYRQISAAMAGGHRFHALGLFSFGGGAAHDAF